MKPMLPSKPSPISQAPPLAEADYQRLRHDLGNDIKQEAQRLAHQQLFIVGIHALMLAFLAVVLFLSSRRYHDMMLWAVGISLLVFSGLEFLHLKDLQNEENWLLQFLKPKSD